MVKYRVKYVDLFVVLLLAEEVRCRLVACFITWWSSVAAARIQNPMVADVLLHSIQGRNRVLSLGIQSCE